MSEFSTYPATAHHAPDGDPSAKDKAAAVAQSGKQAASDVADTATAAAKDVVAEGKQQAGDLLGKTRSQLNEQAEVQQSAIVSTLRDLGDQLAAMTDNDQDGTAIALAAKARDHARSAADWLAERTPGDVVEDLRRVGRDRPGQFLISALLAGVAAGRLTRGAVEVHTDDESGTLSAAASRPSEPPQVLGRHDAGELTVRPERPTP